MYEMTDQEKLQLIEDKRAELSRLLRLATGVDVVVDCYVHSSFQDTAPLADATRELPHETTTVEGGENFLFSTPGSRGATRLYHVSDPAQVARYAHLPENPLLEEVSPLRRLAALARLGQLWSKGV